MKNPSLLEDLHDVEVILAVASERKKHGWYVHECFFNSNVNPRVLKDGLRELYVHFRKYNGDATPNGRGDVEIIP